ncbi:MAG: DUF255 domain-containing protein [Deltaproteobacteria bacterium]|nr:DUF255 domain-containing protein [Deltaproteobacteria bacterium]
MKGKKLNRNRILLCFFVLLGIYLSTLTSTTQGDEALTWVTSKSEAVSKALNEGKLILLLAGYPTCPHCLIMQYTVCETNNPPIKTVIKENYVAWYCNVWISNEYKPYSTAPYVPLVCRIDPRNPEKYIDQSYGSYLYREAIFYNRLLSGLDSVEPEETNSNDTITPLIRPMPWLPLLLED